MRLLILGAGGVGGYFGGRLIEAGMDVTFLVRAKRSQQLQKNGLVIESCYGDSKLSVNTVISGQKMRPPDIVLLACKAHGLGDALTAIRPYVGPGTIIMPLLNGIAHVDVIKKAFLNTTIWGGVAHIGVTCQPNGVVKHLNELHTIIFGPMDGRLDDRSSTFLSMAKSAVMDVQMTESIEQTLWDKFVFLSTIAGMTCLCRADIGTILNAAEGAHLIRQMFDESYSVAANEGFEPQQELMHNYLELLTEQGSTMKASMLRDIENQSTTEGTHILGDMLKRGKKHGLSLTLLTAASVHVHCYEKNRSA